MTRHSPAPAENAPPVPDKPNPSFARSIGWLSLGKLVAQIASWGTTLFVMRLLDPRDYGIAGLAATLFGIIFTISEFGLSRALTQEKTADRQLKSQASGLALILAGGCALVYILASQGLAALYQQPLLTQIALVQTPALLFAALAVVPDSEMQRNFRFGTIALCEVAITLAGTSFALIGALAGLGLWVLVLGQLVQMVMRALVYNIASRGQPMPSWPRKAVVGRLLEFGFSVAPSRLMYYLENSIDVIIGGKFLRPHALGIYNVAVYWSGVPLGKMMVVLNQALYPFLAAKARSDQSMVKETETLTRMIGLLAFPVFWGLIAVASPLIYGLLGDKWGDVLLPLQVICLVMPLRMLLESLSNALQAARALRTMLHNHLLALTTVTIGCIVGVSHGAIGLAIGVALGIAVGNLIGLVRSMRHLGCDQSLVYRSLMRVILAAGLMAVLTERASHALAAAGMPGALSLLLLIPLGGLSYLILIRLLEPTLLRMVIDAVRGRGAQPAVAPGDS